MAKLDKKQQDKQNEKEIVGEDMVNITVDETYDPSEVKLTITDIMSNHDLKKRGLEGSVKAPKETQPKPEINTDDSAVESGKTIIITEDLYPIKRELLRELINEKAPLEKIENFADGLLPEHIDYFYDDFTHQAMINTQRQRLEIESFIVKKNKEVYSNYLSSNINLIDFGKKILSVDYRRESIVELIKVISSEHLSLDQLFTEDKHIDLIDKDKRDEYKKLFDENRKCLKELIELIDDSFPYSHRKLDTNKRWDDFVKLSRENVYNMADDFVGYVDLNGDKFDLEFKPIKESA